jgi:hypothetical protein
MSPVEPNAMISEMSAETQSASDPVEYFEALIGNARQDPDVIGAVVGGGRGKGFVTEHSDYDLYLVVSDDASEGVEQRYQSRDKVEAIVSRWTELQDDLAPDGPTSWNRYNFAHLSAAIDKLDGGFQEFLDGCEFIPSALASQRSVRMLDAYLNSTVRSLKNSRDGASLASHLDAAEAVSWLVSYLFTREGREPPYNRFLAWELDLHPLAQPLDGNERVLEAIRTVLMSGAPDTLRWLFLRVEATARDFSHGEVIGAWGADAIALLNDAH